jgi:hypothetical protein
MGHYSVQIPHPLTRRIGHGRSRGIGVVGA